MAMWERKGFPAHDVAFDSEEGERSDDEADPEAVESSVSLKCSSIEESTASITERSASSSSGKKWISMT